MFFKLLTPLFVSDRLERILHQLSKAIVSNISATRPTYLLISGVLHKLARLENRPDLLTKMAYGWCSVIWENRQSFRDRQTEALLLRSLEIGFRHLDRQILWDAYEFTHTEHHQALADVVFGSEESEAIADLLRAWTGGLRPARTLLSIYAGRLIGLHNLVPLSPRLRQLIIRSVGIIGYKGFEGVGIERFFELLNCLHVRVVDMENKFHWKLLLLDIIKSSEGARYQVWELLVELAILVPRGSVSFAKGWPVTESVEFVYDSHVVESLVESQEWDKLECWMSFVWTEWPPKIDETAEDLEHAMVSLFRRRPSAAQKLEQRMERWGQEWHSDIPESFQRTCKQAYEAAQQNVL